VRGVSAGRSHVSGLVAPSIGKGPSIGREKMRHFPQAGQYEVDGRLTVAVPA
jgi:hypothetical protein